MRYKEICIFDAQEINIGKDQLSVLDGDEWSDFLTIRNSEINVIASILKTSPHILKFRRQILKRKVG